MASVNTTTRFDFPLCKVLRCNVTACLDNIVSTLLWMLPLMSVIACDGGFTL